MAEPLHRQWLHALEDDETVPDYAIQVARVFADFAAGASPRGVHVSWPMLIRCTHQRRNKVSKSIAWLRDNGWLEASETGQGKRSFYRLRAVETSTNGGTSTGGGTSTDGGTQTSTDGGTGTSTDGGTTNVQRQKTSSLGSLDRVRQRFSDLGATERETNWIVGKAKDNPAVLSVGAYLAKALDNGDGPCLIAKARQQLNAEATVIGFPQRKPWCGDPECDKRTRRREDPETGADKGPCSKCSGRAAS